MKIKLSDDTFIDLDKTIESRALFQANSGGGKSWLARRFIEQTFGHKQLIVIDPEGEFGNMRSKFDFVYIAKEGGDAPAEVRSAALLARRLLETKASAIIDIYELGSQRGEFVKAFFDACVNMPKNLWQDCFFLLDEAHKFAPEKGQGESVALSSVIDMASLGRKRGYCLIPMTQRPAKLSKDVIAECNNKFIGRASLDIDRKRSAEELGFNTKEQILSLRDLQPGQFYVFGPAVSRDVVLTQIGDVSVKPPKRGTARAVRIAPPTAKVKKILAELADLPQAAAQEAKTTKELKEALRVATARITTLERGEKPLIQQVSDPRAISDAIKARDKEWEAILKPWKEIAYMLGAGLEKAQKVLEMLPDVEWPDSVPATYAKGITLNSKNVGKVFEAIKNTMPEKSPDLVVPLDMAPVGKGEQIILTAVGRHSDGMTRSHLTVEAGYKQSARDTYISRLLSRGFVELKNSRVFITQDGITALGNSYSPYPLQGEELREAVRARMTGGERKIFEALLDARDGLTRDQITEITTYKQSARDTYISRLRSRELIDIDGGVIKAVDALF